MVANRSLVGCLASLSLAVAALTSCGGGDGRSIPFNDLESESIATACRFNVACGTFPDEATCRASTVTTNGFYPTMRVDIATGRVIYDGAKARECLDLYTAGLSPCTQSGVTALFLTLDTVCAGAFTGTGVPGTQCFFDEECANRGVCEVTTTCTLGCCPGTCVARPAPIPVGGDCATGLPNQSCAQGSLCTYDPTGTSATCRVPTAGEGAAMSNNPTCTVGCRRPGICGDAVVTAPEQCDYGAMDNNGDYGGCAPGCIRAPHCGDAIKNGPEQCDDGILDNSYGGCSPQCRLAPHCGDGMVAAGYEQCDDGAANGPTAPCLPTCRINVL